jgi:ElaB protein
MNASVHDRILEDVSALVDELEQVLHSGAETTEEGLREAQKAARERLRQTRDRMTALKNDAVHRVSSQIRQVDRGVHDHPWLAIGSAVAAAVLLGYALGRRD